MTIMYRRTIACAFTAALFVSCGGLSAAIATEDAVVGASAAPNCAVSLVDPTESGVDADQIIEMLRGITKALADHDFAGMAKYMDDNCSTYNEHTKKLVTGRDNIISDVKSAVESEERRLKVPPIQFTVDHPYVRVADETATVNFVLVKQIGGSHPVKYESHCTDVFVKRNGQWKKLLFRGDDWKVVK